MAERCDRYRFLAALGPDEELSVFEVALLRDHVERCPRCAAYADTIHGFTSALRAARQLRPRGVEAPTVAGLGPGSLRAPTIRRQVLSAVAALALLAIVAPVEPPEPGREHGSVTRETRGSPLAEETRLVRLFGMRGTKVI